MPDVSSLTCFFICSSCSWMPVFLLQRTAVFRLDMSARQGDIGGKPLSSLYPGCFTLFVQVAELCAEGALRSRHLALDTTSRTSHLVFVRRFRFRMQRKAHRNGRHLLLQNILETLRQGCQLISQCLNLCGEKRCQFFFVCIREAYFKLSPLQFDPVPESLY